MMSVKCLNFCQPMLGMDVEFFFQKGDKVVGAEKVFDKGDLVTTNRNGNGQSKFIVDGVQAELNPIPATCRQTLCKEITHCFRELKSHMDKKGVQTNFDGVIEVDKKEFDSLSESSKVFGCMPSFDPYANGDTNKITVDPKQDLKRSAGGHIHLGGLHAKLSINTGMKPECIDCPLDCKELNNISSVNLIPYLKAGKLNIHELVDMTEEKKKEVVVFLIKEKQISESTLKTDYKVDFQIDGVEKALTKPLLLGPMLDLVCGIPSVLLDRDPNVKVRRKVYGKAGDYRLPNHGFEYRTLSNFWIKSYPLMSLFTGLARTAHLIVADELDNNSGIINYFFEGIDKKEVQRIINESDYKGARDIFLKIEPKLLKIVDDDDYDNFPINTSTIDHFKQFVIDGYKKYFDDNVIESWSKNNDYGWENWCQEHIYTKTNTRSQFASLIKD